MKITKYTFPSTIEIVNLGDLHRGDKCCDVKTFYSVRDYIRRTPNCYWVSTGDLLNVALKSSKSDVYSSLSLQEELDEFLGEIHGIREKCLGIVSSNHHDRIIKETGINLDRVLCQMADIPFLGDVGVLNITIGTPETAMTSYYVVLHHGVGGGRTIGAKSNELARLGDVIASADVYLQGHTHQYAYFMLEAPYIDRKRGNVQTICSHFVTTGHYLSWDDSYAQKLKLRPAPIGSALVTLHETRHGRHEGKKVGVDFLN